MNVHSMCDGCWWERNDVSPLKMKDAEQETCCFCGDLTSAGIYVRHDPTELDCHH